MRVAHHHPQPAVAEELGDRTQRRAFHHQPGRKRVPEIMPGEVGNAGELERRVTLRRKRL